MDLVDHAYRMMRSDETLLADARKGTAVGNTVIGSVMSMTLKVPRQVAETAVATALVRIYQRQGTS
jgi:hypothetical protein